MIIDFIMNLSDLIEDKLKLLKSLSAGERVLVVSREEKQYCCHFTWGEYHTVIDVTSSVG